ncbi:LCP family protein [Clostridium isatidis]|uniref:LCP family protein n=1 Tax=Clostridium isatidis TaxID=182773 RepID=UPI000E7069A2|nr:LCP family protein [Clostridium isatidis]
MNSENLENARNRREKHKKKMSKKMKIVITTIVVILAALLIGGISIYNNIRNKIYDEYVPEEKKEESYSEVEGITNVLLIGIDGRTLDEPSRSDSIIIATLDNNNKKIKLTSIIRDTLVKIPNYDEYKINTAFYLGSIEEDENGKPKGAEGGAALLMKTIEENFNLHLDKYVIVNFWGFEDIIDQLGGIDVEVKDYELDEVNKYIGETTGLNSPLLSEPGYQHLNGQQALSYARIRYVGNGGFERAERQNRVLSEVANKFREISPLKYVSLANTMANYVKTNIDIPLALNLAYTIYKLPSLNIEQLQIPQTELIAGDRPYKDKGWSLLIDFEQNSKVLYDFIFNDKLPNVEDFDLLAVQSLAAKYDAEEASYNAIYNINPEDYNDREKEVITDPNKNSEEKKEEVPAKENEEKPSDGNNQADNNNGSNNPVDNNGDQDQNNTPNNPNSPSGEQKIENPNNTENTNTNTIDNKQN